MSDHSKVKSGLSRRKFIGASVGTAALVTAMGTPLFKRDAQAMTPKKGGTMRYGIGHGSTTDTLDPATYENDFTIGFCYMIHNHLVEVLPSGDLAGEIAESFSASDDAKTWTFAIRKGMTFHDGRAVTPADVVASLNHHRGEGTKSAVASIAKTLGDIKVDGDNVVIALEAPNADLPYLLSDYHFAIVASKEGKAEADTGNGCGPYKMEAFNPGVEFKCSRHPNYWKTDRAHFDGVHMRAIADVSARTNALMSGEIDVMDRCDLKTVDLMRANPNIIIDQVSGFQHFTFPMLTNLAPFDNLDARIALKHACPREEMVQKILNGFGTAGSDNPIAKGIPYAADLPARPFDADKAKFHWKKAGLEGTKVPLSVAEAAFAGCVDAGVLYSQRAAEAGIEIEVVREANDGYWSNVWQKKPWSGCYWGGRTTVDGMLTVAYAKGAAWNDTNWENDRFNELLGLGRAELDPAKRTEIYLEAQTLLSDEGGTVVPMFSQYVSASSNKLSHDALANNWAMDGHKFTERWWFN